MQSNNKIQNKIIVVLLALLVVLILFNIKTCNNANQFEKIAVNANNTLRTYKNEKGQQIATISILQGNNSNLQKLNASKDSTLRHLQKIVDKHTISATVLSNTTSNIINAGTTIIATHDTVKKDSLIYIFPKYQTNYKNQFEKFDITATKDSFHLNYIVYNQFEISTRYNRLKWYKSRVPEITVTNLNPHTETVELKNFTVSPPKNQKLIVFLSGVLGGSITTAIIAYKLK